MAAINDYEPIINRLRRLPGWRNRGEMKLPVLFTYLHENNVSLSEFSFLATNYLSTNHVSLNHTRNHVDSIIKRHLSLKPKIASQSLSGCDTCGEKVMNSSWAGRYCAEHVRTTHFRDIDKLSYPETEFCECGERWVLVCKVGVFCRDHSEGVVEECIKGSSIQ